MKRSLLVPRYGVFLSALLFLALCPLTAHAIAPNAPIEPEMLLTLRASPGAGLWTYPWHKTQTPSHMAMRRTLSYGGFFPGRSFGIGHCFEGAPHRDFSPDDHSFLFSVTPNERLIDLLQRLEQAADGHLCWRLLEGRLIFTVLPKDDSLPIGDRKVTVDINAEFLGEALLQLEKAYNEQHDDVPLGFHTTSFNFYHSTPSAGGHFRIQGEEKLRNIIVSLLNQWDSAQMTYSLMTSTSLSSRKREDGSAIARNYFKEKGLYYYSLYMGILQADLDEDQRLRWKQLDGQWEGDVSYEEKHLWALKQFPALTERLMAYFDGKYPDRAAEEDAAKEATTATADEDS